MKAVYVLHRLARGTTAESWGYFRSTLQQMRREEDKGTKSRYFSRRVIRCVSCVCVSAVLHACAGIGGVGGAPPGSLARYPRQLVVRDVPLLISLGFPPPTNRPAGGAACVRIPTCIVERKKTKMYRSLFFLPCKVCRSETALLHHTTPHHTTSNHITSPPCFHNQPIENGKGRSSSSSSPRPPAGGDMNEPTVARGDTNLT